VLKAGTPQGGASLPKPSNEIDPNAPVAWGKPALHDFPQIARMQAWVISRDAANIEFMANNSGENKRSEGKGATAAGMVEAVTQDVELIVERVKDTAQEAVAAVEEKLGVRKAPAARPRKPAKKQKPKANAAKPKAKATKPMKSSAVKPSKRSKGKKRK